MKINEMKLLKAETENKILKAVQEFSDKTGLGVDKTIGLTIARTFGPSTGCQYIEVKMEVKL